jgi:hypothetical protein
MRSLRRQRRSHGVGHAGLDILSKAVWLILELILMATCYFCALQQQSLAEPVAQENPDKLHHHAKHTTVVATSFSSYLDPSTYQFPKPTMIHTETKAREVEESIGYIFSDRRIAVEAVQMAAPQIALIHNGAFLGLNNNKRLSVLGDAVLAKVLCSAWFDARNPRGKKRFPSAHVLRGTEDVRPSAFSGAMDANAQRIVEQRCAGTPGIPGWPRSMRHYG